jgi:phosphohistidine swiveling domain-containing protein
MLKLLGQPVSRGIAVGSAMVLRAADLRATLDLFTAYEARHREHLGFVAVCRDIALGEALWRAGAGVSAIVAESPAPPQGGAIGVPALVGVSQLLLNVRDGDIVIVDANHGVLIVDPDMRLMTQYQRQEMHPSGKRYVLGLTHETARTLDDHPIRVIALSDTWQDAVQSLEAGADGAFLDAYASEQCLLNPAALHALLQGAAGKSLLLELPVLPDEAIWRAIAESTLQMVITFVLPSLQQGEVYAFLDCLQQAQSILEEEQGALLFQDALLGGWTPPFPLPDIPEVANIRAVYLRETAVHSWFQPQWLQEVENLTMFAQTRLLARGIVLGAESEWLIPLAVGVGISELLLPPYHVASAKEMIPYLSYEQCRELVRHLQVTDDVSRNRQKARRFYYRLKKQIQNE